MEEYTSLVAIKGVKTHGVDISWILEPLGGWH